MNYAIILAAGVGQRMRSGGLPKQFLQLMGKPIIVYTLEKFEQTDEIDGIIVQINEESHEQSSFMENVNRKIGVIADYVTSAAANAEESAAASEELNGQASELKKMLSNFGI